eukprot:CAMPEP_0118684904 /NCGR_PEP_ID=MMETSP0800-20121206/6917_1 /TAXON_ID=210618 ORGANISM="Striatella unipunctata, Strain CCMP2910" /NCGR_SAMPLE_ID=MMETSP0800 /ASSEMBLY_ACC=CAM_ASM_000638 /LENGTH=281 /DNA_ID=CAMNT_0006581691 /DNA_START=159 /DNA_END=1004 /DNA_ORIENTATION=+
MKSASTGWVRSDGGEGTQESQLVLTAQIRNGPTIERNRRGVKTLNCEFLLGIEEFDQDEMMQLHASTTNSTEEADNVGLLNKKERHKLFAEWLVNMFGIERLSKGTGVLDVAGGNGELSRSLHQLGVPSILIDPNPRCGNETQLPFEIIAKPLVGDGSDLIDGDDSIGSLTRNCSIVVGMHPDQATEAIVDIALRLGVPFAFLPCCVMPKLFPHRIQKRHGDPVRSYRTFCQYLLDKAPVGVPFEVDYLPFIGRNTVIFSRAVAFCQPVHNATDEERQSRH